MSGLSNTNDQYNYGASVAAVGLYTSVNGIKARKLHTVVKKLSSTQWLVSWWMEGICCDVACMYVRIYLWYIVMWARVCIYVCKCMYLCVCACMYVCMHVCNYIRTVCMYMRMNVFVYASIYICQYVCGYDGYALCICYVQYFNILIWKY